MNRILMAGILIVTTIVLLVASVVTYNSMNTSSDVTIEGDGGSYVFNVNADKNTSVTWRVSDSINSALDPIVKNGHTASVVLDPGRYTVMCSVIDLQGGERTVRESLVVNGMVTRTFSWMYDGSPCLISHTFDYTDVNNYCEMSISRSIRTADGITEFITVDANIRAMALKLADMYKGIVGKEPVVDGLDYAEFLLDFVQYGFTYKTDKESKGVSEYWKFPLETIYDMNGDCEDTSILFSALASASGYTSVGIFLLPGHAVAAVALDDIVSPGTGTLICVDKNGRSHYCAETTATGWNIGYTSASFMDAMPLLYAGDNIV